MRRSPCDDDGTRDGCDKESTRQRYRRNTWRDEDTNEVRLVRDILGTSFQSLNVLVSTVKGLFLKTKKTRWREEERDET